MSAKILTVDDAIYMRTMLKKILETEGFSTCEAGDGEAGLAAYETEKPDLVLMDITMPGMDGITATRTIVEKYPEAKVVICSALGQQQMVLEAVKAGASEYVVKPFEPAQVIEVVKRLLTQAA